MVRLLLAAGADVHAQHDDAMYWAAGNGHVVVVRALITATAGAHVFNESPLHHAARRGHADVVRLLLTVGANVHAANDYALRLAAESGHVEAARILLAAGADSMTAWTGAAALRHDRVVLTLDACADSLTPEQCTALLAVSGRLIRIQAISRSRFGSRRRDIAGAVPRTPRA